jgi:hypothetical protein
MFWALRCELLSGVTTARTDPFFRLTAALARSPGARPKNAFDSKMTDLSPRLMRHNVIEVLQCDMSRKDSFLSVLLRSTELVISFAQIATWQASCNLSNSSVQIMPNRAQCSGHGVVSWINAVNGVSPDDG